MIRAVFKSKGIHNEDVLFDAIHDVVVACLAHVKKTGERPDLKGQIILARSIANKLGFNQIRDGVRRGRTNVGSTGEPDAHARDDGPQIDFVDRQRLIDLAHENVPPAQIEVLIDVASGTSYTEIAAETGQSPEALRQSAKRSRDKMIGESRKRGYGQTLAALLVIGAVAFVAGKSLQGPGDSTRGKPSNAELAAGDRTAAANACNAQKWDVCEHALDEAAKVDPDSDRRIEVKALRAAIAAGRRPGGQ